MKRHGEFVVLADTAEFIKDRNIPVNSEHITNYARAVMSGDIEAIGQAVYTLFGQDDNLIEELTEYMINKNNMKINN